LKLKDRSQRYAETAPRTLRNVFGRHLGLPAADLTRDQVVRAHDALAKSAPIMAARAVGYGSAAYAWAIKRGTLQIANPFARLEVAPTTKRERVLEDDEIRRVWAATEAPGPFNAIVRALILTGQRRSEVGGMVWDELSPDLATWTIPGARTKNCITHVVRLSPQAQAIVAAEPRSDATSLVFPGRFGANAFNGYAQAKVALDRASGVTNWTLHDLRRTCATGLQKLGVRLEVTEAVLNHTSSSRGGIVGVYQRHDWAYEKRAALQAWADRLDAIVGGRADVECANVVALRALGSPQGFRGPNRE
jgi:integrase